MWAFMMEYLGYNAVAGHGIIHLLELDQYELLELYDEVDMKRIASVLLRIIGTAQVIVSLLIALLVLVPQVLGYSSYVVVSPSMEPTLPVETVVYVKEVAAEDVKPGDIITFYNHENSKTPVTHRVVENNTDKRQFVTKGDANEKEDITPISYLFYVGKVMFQIKWAGKILIYLSTGSGKIFYFCFLLLGIILLELAELLSGKPVKEKV